MEKRYSNIHNFSILTLNRMPADIMTDSEGMYSEITMQDFSFLIGGSLQVVLKKNENSHEVKI